MIATVDHEPTVRLVARIFLEAMEMGGLAKRYPRVIFTIGGSVVMWSAPEQFDLFANAARLGVAIAGNNVASGIHDHASIATLLYKDNWRYAKGSKDKPAIAIAGWVVREMEYAFVIQDGTHMFPQNYSETSMGLALVAADAQGKAIMARDA
jgi:hypothetical protein